MSKVFKSVTNLNVNPKYYLLCIIQYKVNISNKHEPPNRRSSARMARFGKILKALGNFEPTLATWVNFHCCKWPNIQEIILTSSHTGRTYALF